MEIIKKERLDYVDVAKGLLILSVIWHHLPLDASKYGGISSPTLSFMDYANSFYVCFFMQAFFFITGYCSNFNKTIKEQIWRNFRTLIVPAFCFCVICTGIRALTRGSFSPFMKFCQADFWLYGFKSYWFLFALFLAKNIYAFIIHGLNNVKYGKYIKWSLIFVLLIFSVKTGYKNQTPDDHGLLPNYLFWQNALINLPFLALGDQLKGKLNDKIMWVGSIAFMVLILILFAAPTYIPRVGQFPSMHIRHILEFLTLGSLGSIFVLQMSKFIKKWGGVKWFGKESLIVYCMHGLILNIMITIIANYVIYPLGVVSSVLYIICVMLSTVVILIPFIYLVNTKYLSWIIGK